MVRSDWLWTACRDLAALVFPPRCPGCMGQTGGAEGWCGACSTLVEPVDGAAGCPTCADLGVTGVCVRCREQPPPFDRVVAGAWFAGPVRDAIHRLKYRHGAWVARPLTVAVLGPALPACRGVDLVVPVPLHVDRQRERGFNQAELVAQVLAERLRVPLRPHALQRTRGTSPQARRTRAVDREAALDDAMRPHPRAQLGGRLVLLVDDVVTTTATVRASASALRQGGAAGVVVACLARAGTAVELPETEVAEAHPPGLLSGF